MRGHCDSDIETHSSLTLNGHYIDVIVCICISGNRYHGSEHISRLPAASLVLAPSWAIIKCFMLPVLCVAVAGAVLELVDTKLTEHYTWLVNHLLARACAAPPAAAARRIIVTCSWCSPWPPIISTQRS